MAASHRYDEHSADFLRIWLAAVKRHPAPAEMSSRVQDLAPQARFSEDDIAASTAMMLATALDTSAYARLNTACTDAQHKAACIAIARLMFVDGRSLISVTIGESRLRSFDALGQDDQLRARRIAWWSESTMTFLMSSADATNLYARDVVATGSEIEALRLAATRAGKVEPPADWKSRNEKQAAKAAAKKATSAGQ